MLKVYDNTAAQPATQAADLPYDQILIEGLVLEAFIGVFDLEYGKAQPVRFDLVIDIEPLSQEAIHETHNIVRYDHIVTDIKAILAGGHVDLVETLAEQVAKACLAYDRAHQACVSVAKLDAIDEAQAVGVRITRRK